MNRRQYGFTALEALLILIIVGLVALIGYKVYNTKQVADKSANSAVSVIENTPVAESNIPSTINTADDLTKAEKVLDDYDSSQTDNSDLTKLESELSAF